MNVRCDCAGCVYENQKAGEDPCYRCLHESEYISGGPESHSYPQSKATSTAGGITWAELKGLMVDKFKSRLAAGYTPTWNDAMKVVDELRPNGGQDDDKMV